MGANEPSTRYNPTSKRPQRFTKLTMAFRNIGCVSLHSFEIHFRKIPQSQWWARGVLCELRLPSCNLKTAHDVSHWLYSVISSCWEDSFDSWWRSWIRFVSRTIGCMDCSGMLNYSSFFGSFLSSIQHVCKCVCVWHKDVSILASSLIGHLLFSTIEHPFFVQ